MKIKASVLIASADPLVRRGFRLIFADQRCCTVVAEASSSDEAIEYVAEAKPDLVVLDPSTPGMDGIAAIPPILDVSPRTGVLVLSVFEREKLAAKIIHAGAPGSIPESDIKEELSGTISLIADEGVYFRSSVANETGEGLSETRLRDEMPTHNGESRRLSPREDQILNLIAEGNNNREIATRLGLSTRTIENMRSRIMHKLGSRSCGDLIRRAIRLGLLEA